MRFRYNKYGKPIMVTEYGADTVTGIHLDPSEMFSEEFQLSVTLLFLVVSFPISR